MFAAFAARRKLVQDGLSKIPGVECREPEGARSTCFPCGRLVGKIVAGVAIRTSDDFARVCLESPRALMPGSSFGLDGYIRISYAARRRPCARR